MMAPEAFRGWLGDWIRSLERYTEADPVALLSLTLGALGHCIRKTTHLPGKQPLNQLLILVGDEGARVGAAWNRVENLYAGAMGRKEWEEEKKKTLLAWPQPPPAPNNRREWAKWAVRWEGGHASMLVQSTPEEVLDWLAEPQAPWSRVAARTLLLRVHGRKLPLGESDQDLPSKYHPFEPHPNE